MYKIKSNLVAALFLVIGYSATAIAQAETVEFTLEEAQNYAIENSYMSIMPIKMFKLQIKKYWKQLVLDCLKSMQLPITSNMCKLLCL